MHGRAATKHRPGSVVLSRPFERICPWQTLLCLRPDLAEHVRGLDDLRRQLVEDRYGLAGNRPRLLSELAADTGRTATAVARLLAGAVALLRQDATKRRSDGGEKRRSDEAT